MINAGPTMNPELQYRYPGLEPFSPAQKAQFFGRTADLGRLLEMVQTHQQVLLYAKSGLGKSSLLNAGLVPSLAASAAAAIIPIRIGAYLDAQSPSPLEAVRGALPIPASSLLDRIIHQEGSLWYHLKAESLQHSTPKTYYLLFDQFEEIFSHPDEHIFAFKKQMADLLYRIVPQHFKSVLEIRQRENPQLLSAGEWDQLFQPLEIKVVYAIREDRYSELNRLADYLPDLLHHRYQLGPLSRSQAEEAIVRPAQLAGAFHGKPFRYTDMALVRILDYLTGGQQESVETTQLQILCSHMERLGKATVTVADIPEFDNIFLQFYDESIACIAPEDQARARTFIETKMIIHEQRIAYHRLACLECIPESALDTLLRERHLLRTERSSTGGISYELSHDTLVAPILMAKRRREMEESRRAREAARFQAEMEREIAEKKLREDLAKTRLARMHAQRQLRRTRMALICAVVGIALAIGGGVAAVLWAREAEEQRGNAVTAMGMAIHEQKIATAAQARAEEATCVAEELQTALANELVRELVEDAESYRAYNQGPLELQKLERAMDIDPGRLDLLPRIESLRKKHLKTKN
jgi:hypothetical protein